ncbi:hypothetical protein [Halorubrum halodurans]|uniref:hypothetical protein n=1 Tax=Halorubrum halodurans TaxID=1383851 RepID=UPI00117A55AC|nr:hypothetical protein [Halorubrum halodurans]
MPRQTALTDHGLTAPAPDTHREPTATVQFNATGRYTITNHPGTPDHVTRKIRNHGIMDPVELTQRDLDALLTIVEDINAASDAARNVHWLNTAGRIRSAYRTVTTDQGHDQ